MRERPLCYGLLVFLLIQCIRYIGLNGQSLVTVPASSIFSVYDELSDVTVKGKVYKKAIQETYQILYLKNNSITYQNQTFQEAYIIVYDKNFQKVKIGEEVLLSGSLSEFENARNPGNFDAKIYYAKQKLFGSIWSKEICEISGKENRFLEKIFCFRQAWKERLFDELGEDYGALLSAMLLSEKGDVDAETKELYQKNGYGHLLAISGLHISFIGLGCYKIMRKIGMGYGSSGMIAIIILSFYVVILGFSVSVFRAFLMLIIRIIADITGRVYDMPTALSISATGLALYEPLYIVDGAFLMSHGAILAIIGVTPILEQLGIHKLLASSLAIQITTFPIVLWNYYELSTYAIIWNLLVIPLMSVLLSLGLLGSIVPIQVCFLGCKWILQFYEFIGTIGSKLPINNIILGKPTHCAMCIYYSWLLLMIILIRKKKGKRKYILLSFIIVCMLFVKFPQNKLCITMLDVGQGECIYLQGPKGKSYLIDGGSSDVSQVGKYRIETFLKSQGVASLDYVFVSHGDNDHISGIKEMLERKKYGVNIKKLVFPETYKKDEELIELMKLAAERDVSVCCMKMGDSIKEGELTITCLQPNENNNFEGNAASMVLSLSYRSFQMLFTGDVEAEGEEALVRKMQGQTCDILKVAHHGSKYSTTEKFLQVTKPKIALISVGENNSYGHPHAEVLERLKKYGCHIMQTQEEGAITLKSDGNSLTF